MLRKLFLLPCLIAGVLATANAAPEDEEVEAVNRTPESEIVIGQSVPTTGIAADTGKALALGASLYFGRVNARGGINGAVVNHKVLDDGNNPQKAVQNTRDLLDKQGAALLVNYYGSATATELTRSKVLANANVALVGVHGGAELIRLPADPNIFQTRAGYTQELEKTVQLLTGNLGITRVGALVQDDADGQAALKSLKDALTKRQLKLEVEATFNAKSGDVAAATKTLAKANPQAVIVLAISRPAANFVKQFKAAGGTSQLYGISLIQFEDVIRIAGKKDAHGLGISQVYPYPSNMQLRFIREFQEDAGAVLRSGEYPSYAVLEGYLSARLAVEALKRAGKNPTRQAVYNALTSMNRLDLGGYVIDFSANKRLGSSFVELTMISPTGTLTR
ncbi:ABC transporter substrate-binding protein [Chitiniphilus shinanonensis]|uniref:ABC transporter substrate-binding protein n=1 Tax=Chitiniphilus shinanonensis TaxID=553088 RepID=A0ABQ6BTL8_9NEIS|nr:ABC transporter substrate-binding protein [Chitiniphilus shinanonensis]GLS05350.1 ABC transporter substrate-binding protein [Chitiniphilus shinanonensis]